MNETFHILPDNDTREHFQLEICHCNPRVEPQPNGNKLVVHNSYDGREFFEDDDEERGH